MNTINLGKGAIESGYDIRDYQFEPTDRGGFDWKEGFDIEKVLGHKIVVKDQNGSGSCGGQAWSYYGEVLESIATGNYEPRSARWIYSHTRIPPSGSRGRDNCAFVIKNGFAWEAHAPSYDGKKPPKEEFMAQIPKLSKEGNEEREVSLALSYLGVKANIDICAQAVQENNGMVIVLNGADNGTWRTAFPKPPKTKEWGHFLYVGGAKLIKGKKYLKVINSWGKDTGEQGWQYIGEDYFNSGHVREGWTLAWDYQPAKTKLVLKQIVSLLTRAVELYKSLIKTK